uniref:Lipoxygenase domain-containing protein n=1 Tax=Hippocampus comes TaxID=109280 RepID=A0A3Q2YKX3_HIPCM
MSKAHDERLYSMAIGITQWTDHMTLQWTKIWRLGKYTVKLGALACAQGFFFNSSLDKRQFFILPGDAWFPDKVEIKSPENDIYTFPIYCWISDSETHRFREGKGWFIHVLVCHHLFNTCKKILLPNYLFIYFLQALRIFDESHPLGQYAREQELSQRTLGAEILGRSCMVTENFFPDYVQQHWKEDDFFAYQYLNGPHPTLIRRCKTLPGNFPVTDDMVFIPNGSNLSNELKRGNIYLCDYKHLDGLQANTIQGIQQYLMAPLVLFHKRPDDKLMPIAIQLKQTPAEDNPIFLPTDSTYDWLTAKIFVRSADFTEHQLNAHLLRTHLLAEVFAVSLLRNLPMVHPLYKLLVPHTRYTLQINEQARDTLIGPKGSFTLFAASGGESVTKILARSQSSITYRSLCIPDDIADRIYFVVTYEVFGRMRALRYNLSLQRFVQGMIQYYYKSDDEIQRDSELQTYIGDIFEHGFLSQPQSGIPQSFTTVSELIKFATMVMFTSSSQHAAVNNGQFDYGGWMPNTPLTLQRPPPTKKGTTSEATMLQTLPVINVTVQGMAVVWLLSRQSSDFVPLGHYPEDHFTEEIPRQLQKDYKAELDKLSTTINNRNKTLEIPYTYLDPKNVENSVAI